MDGRDEMVQYVYDEDTLTGLLEDVGRSTIIST